MKLGTINKQPAERFSYTVDYSEALTAGDNIESATATVSPLGLTIDNVGAYDPRVKFWASGGSDGVSYKVSLTVLSADGRVFQDEIILKVKEI